MLLLIAMVKTAAESTKERAHLNEGTGQEVPLYFKVRRRLLLRCTRHESVWCIVVILMCILGQQLLTCLFRIHIDLEGSYTCT